MSMYGPPSPSNNNKKSSEQIGHVHTNDEQNGGKILNYVLQNRLISEHAKAVGGRFLSGIYYIWFMNIQIPNMGRPTMLYSLASFQRADGIQIASAFTRPSKNSNEFDAYFFCRGGYPKLPQISAKKALVIYSFAACWWCDNYTRSLPDGFDYDRLSPCYHERFANAFSESQFIHNVADSQMPEPIVNLVAGRLNMLGEERPYW